MDVCLQVLKESNRSNLLCNFDSCSVRNRSYLILPFGIVVYTFFPTTFLEIAVYQVKCTIVSFYFMKFILLLCND